MVAFKCGEQPHPVNENALGAHVAYEGHRVSIAASGGVQIFGHAGSATASGNSRDARDGRISAARRSPKPEGPAMARYAVDMCGRGRTGFCLLCGGIFLRKYRRITARTRLIKKAALLVGRPTSGNKTKQKLHNKTKKNTLNMSFVYINLLSPLYYNILNKL